MLNLHLWDSHQEWFVYPANFVTIVRSFLTVERKVDLLWCRAAKTTRMICLDEFHKEKPLTYIQKITRKKKRKDQFRNSAHLGIIGALHFVQPIDMRSSIMLFLTVVDSLLLTYICSTSYSSDLEINIIKISQMQAWKFAWHVLLRRNASGIDKQSIDFFSSYAFQFLFTFPFLCCPPPG